MTDEIMRSTAENGALRLQLIDARAEIERLAAANGELRLQAIDARREAETQREIALRAERDALLSAQEKYWRQAMQYRAENDALREALDRLQQTWADNAPAVRYKTERDALRADVERLNQMLRDNGLGQGEIDAWANAIEERDALRRLLGECSQFMAAFSEECCAASWELRQACELEQTYALDAAMKKEKT